MARPAILCRFPDLPTSPTHRTTQTQISTNMSTETKLIENASCPKCDGTGEHRYEDCECYECDGLGMLLTDAGEEVANIVHAVINSRKRSSERRKRDDE